MLEVWLSYPVTVGERTQGPTLGFGNVGGMGGSQRIQGNLLINTDDQLLAEERAIMEMNN